MAGFFMEQPMTATILQFRPRPNPTRDTAQLIQSMYEMTWGPYFAWAALMGSEPVDVEPKDLDSTTLTP